MYSLFLYIFAVHVSGAICTHPQEHKPAEYSRRCVYWLWYVSPLEQVRAECQYQFQWTNVPQTLHTPNAVVLLRMGTNTTQNMWSKNIVE
jgi:hypothetical protein